MSAWRRLPRIGRVPARAEVESEVESHLTMQIADLVAEGWTPEAARAEAVRRFGDRQRFEREMLHFSRKHEDDVRRSEYLDELRQDLRQSWRQMRKRPAFALAAMVVIALGIGANAAVFAVIDAAFLKPLPFDRDEQLVLMWDRQGTELERNPSFPEFRDWERHADFMQGVTAVFGNGLALRTDDGSELIIAGMLAGDPQRTFGARTMVGRWFSREEVAGEARLAVLDAAFWRERYGSAPSAIGQTLNIDSTLYTIIGVTPSSTSLVRGGYPVGVWLPFKEDTTFRRGNHFLRVIGRLRADVNIEQAQARADVVSKQIQATAGMDHGIHLAPLREFLVGDSRRTFYTLGAASFLLLLIVCANLANLFLSRSVDRSSEFALRAALGASRRRLVSLVLTDALAISMLGGLAGLYIATLLIAVVRGVAANVDGIPPASALDARVIVFTLAMSLLAALIFGLGPALRAPRPSLGNMLSTVGSTRAIGSRALWLRRRALVAGEVALTLVLLVGAGLLMRSLLALLDEPRGFQTESTLAFRVQLNSTRYRDTTVAAAAIATIEQRVRALPGVTAVGSASHLPLEGGDTYGGIGIPGRQFPEDAPPHAQKRVVSSAYFQTLGIPLLRGRAFNDADRRGTQDVVIISDKLARQYWPNQNPIGQRVRFQWGPGEEQEIVGVVGDVRHEALDQQPMPMIYRPIQQFVRRGYQVVARSAGDPAALEPLIRREIAALDPSTLFFDVRTMDTIMSTSIASRRTLMLLVVIFSSIAMLIAAVGVYAVTAQSVGSRTRELGVRAAIGARPGEILRLVLGEEAVPITIGLVAGIAVALALTRWIASLLHGVSARDPIAFGVAIAALLLTALVATLLPARRAARTDPMQALRME
jgi:putative ABC transport system permease protein